jgi:hypothetical protein
MSRQTKTFDTTLEALDFQDSLNKDKIKSSLSHDINKDNVTWIVSWNGPAIVHRKSKLENNA